MTAPTLLITTPTDREIAMTRVFDAPRSLVFDAMTKPELMKRWYHGPDGWILSVCEVDLRVGGRYRCVWSGEGKKDMAMGGEYREIVVPERIVQTEQFEKAWYPGEAIITLEFAEQDGKTTFTGTMTYDTREIRDAVAKSGMERGVTASYDRLADLLATL